MIAQIQPDGLEARRCEQRELADKTVLGLDVGGTKTAIVEGTARGEILQRAQIPTQAERPFQAVWPLLESHMRSTIDVARSQERTVVAISVAIGGPLSIEEGFLYDPPHLPGWHDIGLRAHLSSCFPSLVVDIEHDGNAGALAEFRFGVGSRRRNLRSLVFLTFGTGLGAGLILNGAVVRGASDTAGEVGHWRLSGDGPVGYGKAGSWEAYASGAGLLQRAREMYPRQWNERTTVRQLVEAMLADDPQALCVAAEAGRWMGRGIALLIDALNPEVVVIGSLAVALGERVLAPIRSVVAAEALPRAVKACEIVSASLGERLGDIASLMAALVDPVVMQQLKCAS